MIRLTTQQNAAQATHWSTRKMAAVVGISEASVRRIWRAHGLRPHRLESFKVSQDPQFAQKGLYANSPEHEPLLCCDEKSQLQALDRTQPGLPLKPGRAGSWTHHKHHGTTTLFAALNALDGTVISLRQQRHRHQE